jgi:hypothetical protein
MFDVHSDETYMSDSNVVSSILSPFYCLYIIYIVRANNLYALLWSILQSCLFACLLIKPATVNAEDVQLVQEEEKRAEECQCQISNNPEFESVINLLDNVML